MVATTTLLPLLLGLIGLCGASDAHPTGLTTRLAQRGDFGVNLNRKGNHISLTLPSTTSYPPPHTHTRGFPSIKVTPTPMSWIRFDERHRHLDHPHS